MLKITKKAIKPLLFIICLSVIAITSISVSAYDFNYKKKIKKHRMNYKSFSPDPRSMLRGKPSFMIMQGQDMSDDEGLLIYDAEGNQILPCGKGGNCHPNYALVEYEEPIYEYTVKIYEMTGDQAKNSVPKIFNNANADDNLCSAVMASKIYFYPPPCVIF